jgi:hypothetical protein
MATTSRLGSEIVAVAQLSARLGLIDAPSMMRAVRPVPLSMTYPKDMIDPRRATVDPIQ